MKFCSRCKQEKTLDEFYFKNKSKGIRQSQCKDCSSIYQRKHYIDNKDLYLERSKRDKEKSYKRYKDYVNSFKSSCFVCNENHIATLDFHHIDPLQKEFTVSRMYSMKKAKDEIDKCVVLCSNCHRKFHWGDPDVVKLVNTSHLKCDG